MSSANSAGAASTFRPSIWIYPRVDATPSDAMQMEDTDDNWEQALSNPEITADKVEAPAFCGCELTEDAPAKKLIHAVQTHCMVLDVDEWREDRPPYTLEDLIQRLDGFRFIAYSSYSSTAEKRKWRVIIPLAAPVPLAKHVSLFRWLVGEVFESTVLDKVRDAVRLGFFRAVKNEASRESYQWHVHHGEYFDWRGLHLPDEDPTLVKQFTAEELAPKPEWSATEQALKEAKRKFGSVGKNVGPGERHDTLLQVGCQLWWDWAFSDEQVREILEIVNDNFVEPKPPDQVEMEVRRSWERVLGESRVEQLGGNYGHEREPELRISKTGLGELGKTLRRSTSSDVKRMAGKALQAIAAGEVFADVTESGGVLSTVLETIAGVYPDETPERIRDVISTAVNAQRARSSSQTLPTDEAILAQLRGHQRAAQKRRTEREEQEQDSQKQRYRRAFESDRDYPYTAKELKTWEDAGFQAHHWIVQCGRAYYFWVDGEYRGPFDKDEAQNFGPVLLSPACERISLEIFKAKEGTRERALGELIRDYGTRVKSVESRMAANTSAIEGSVLVVPAYDPPKLDPVRSEIVEQWLQHLAGRKYEDLCDWITQLTSLDRPLAALMMATPPGVGKNLLACGVARLWGRSSPLPLPNYGEPAFPLCPVVFCDEQLPVSWRRGFSTKLRQLVSEGARPMAKPYIGVSMLAGYPRLIFAANTVEKLFASDDMAIGDDVKALQERVLLIADTTRGVHPARAYLESLAQQDVNHIAERGLAEHVLWLRDNRTPPRARFGVRADVGEDMRSALLLNREGQKRLLDWMASFIQQRVFPFPALVFDGTSLLVQSTLVHTNWSLYDNTKKGMGPRELQIALKSIALESVQMTVAGKRGRYQKLDMDLFSTWAETSGLEDELADALVALQAKYPVTIDD